MSEKTLWTFHMLAGLVMILCLGIHLFLNGLDYILLKLGLINYSDPTSWQAIIIKGKNILYTLNLIILVPLVAFHGLRGLRNILVEVIKNANVNKIISYILVVIGIFLTVFGWWVIIKTFAIATLSSI